MPPPELPTDHLLDAILDGTPIDWAGAKSAEAGQPFIAQLKAVAAVARFYRDSSPEVAGTSRLWGHLRLIEQIGRGTFGEVYRAWDTRLDREVALKLLPADPSSRDREASAIIHEGRLLARVRHPNVVTIYGAEQISDQIGLWMEFVRGQTLEQMLDERKVVGAFEAVGIGVELCNAMSAVHNAGLLHRDIKTHNVMRAEDGRVMLMDFGTGRELDNDASSDLAGTPLYLAPEVLRGQPATVQSDIYSLGVVLYRLVTGSYPVHGRTVGDIRRAHERRERMAVHKARRDVPLKLAAIIERAIDPSAERRYDSAEALKADLAALNTRPQAATAAPHAERLRARRGVAAAVAGVLVAAAVTLLMSREVLPLSTSVQREADQLYLRGRLALEERTVNNAHTALELFQKALAIDERHASAYAGIASAYLQKTSSIPAVPPATATSRAQWAVERALSLDNRLPEAHLAAAQLWMTLHDWPRAGREYERAIELAPNHSIARQEYAQWLSYQGRFDEALKEARLGESLDPLSLGARNAVAEVLRHARRFDEAITQAQRVLDLNPNYGRAHSILGHSYLAQGRLDAAIDEHRRSNHSLGNLGFAYAVAGRTKDARDLLAQMQERYAAIQVGPGEIAQVYIGLKEYERAFEWLARGVEDGSVWTLKVAVAWDPLRSDPRFDQLVRKAFSGN